jgi:DNA-binding PadR family transcriptional regulator
MSSQHQLQGVLDLLVLKALSGREMHGYRILEQMRLAEPHIFCASEGSLYPLLAKLEVKGYIDSRWEDRRKLYCLTSAGSFFLQDRMSQWQNFSTAVGRFLSADEVTI